MNCQAAQRLLSAERDGALGNPERAALASHVDSCADCRQMQGTLTEAAEAWRANTAAVKVPDAQMEWQRVRRRLHEAPAARTSKAKIFWWSAPLVAAAAAVAIVVGVNFGDDPAPRTHVRTQVARADSVEVGGDASAAMVYVDAKSDWLVVWAPSDKDKG